MSYYTANQALYWDGSHLTSAYTGRRALNAGDVVPDGEVSRDGLDTAGLVTLQSGGVPSRSGADVLEIWQSSRAYLAGQEILDPTGVTILVRKADGTSRSTYDTTEQALWAAGGGGSAVTLTPTAVKTANYTAVAGDLVPVDTTSGNVTVTLPTAPADKAQIGVKHVVRGGTNTVTIAAGGSDVFNKTGGSATATLTLLNQGTVLQYKASGAIWYVVSTDLPLSQLDTRYGTPLAPWTANTAYSAGASVLYTGVIWTARTSFTSGTKFAFADWTPVGPVPNVEGSNYYSYGHSYAAGSGGTSGQGFPFRVSKRGNIFNALSYGVGGTRMFNQLVYALGAGTGKTLPTPLTYGFGTLVSAINDASDYVGSGGSSKVTTNYAGALRGFLALWGAGSRAESSLFNNWTPVNTANASGSQYGTTTTQNDFARHTFTLTAPGTVYPILEAYDDGYSAGPSGAAFSIKEGSTVLYSGTSSNSAYHNANWPYCPVGIALSAGSHTIDVVKTDANGTTLGVDCILTPSTAPQAQLVIVKEGQVTSALYEPGRATINALTTSIVNEVCSGWANPPLVIDMDANGWDVNTMLNSDGLHPNDRGHAHITDVIMSSLASLGFRSGLNTL